MDKKQLLERIEQVEKIARKSKVDRMIHNPTKYFHALFFRLIPYRINKQEKEVVVKTFFDKKMHILLPASTDIYLTGGKAHDSETRLAKYIIRHLSAGDTFVDVGAHYGYFSLLAALCVGEKGKIFAFEAAPKTYKILEKNCVAQPSITIKHCFVADEQSEVPFYEFPNLYSEYNSTNIEQFKHEAWFNDNPPKLLHIPGISLDDFLLETAKPPSIIKIDVEGAEDKVISGLCNTLSKQAPDIVLEYLSDYRGNKAHKNAERILATHQYIPMGIDSHGNLIAISSVSTFLDSQNLDSDNIVFRKKMA